MPCILVVDDDADIRESVRIVLEDEGHSVAEVANGSEALGYLRDATTPPRLILLDLGMPVMNGWEFRDRQRREQGVSSIPVVVFTAAGDALEKIKGLDPAAVLAKPFRMAALLDIVGQYCARGGCP